MNESQIMETGYPPQSLIERLTARRDSYQETVNELNKTIQFLESHPEFDESMFMKIITYGK